MVKGILKNSKQSTMLTLPDVKSCYKVTAVKKCVFAQGKRLDGEERTRSPGGGQRVCDHLAVKRVALH